jgi:hypothetical protein
MRIPIDESDEDDNGGEIYISSQQWCTLPWPNRESVSEDCAAGWKEV